MSQQVLKFKAGRVEYNEETGDAVPKRGQGLIEVTQGSDDEPWYTFAWKPRNVSGRRVDGRSAQQAEADELMIFPGDAEWKHVPECTTGRVFVLRFKSSDAQMFFWMQEPNNSEKLDDLTAEDKRILAKMEEILTEPDEDEDVAVPDADVAPAAPAESTE